MIWQYQIQTVVMVTNLMEGQKVNIAFFTRVLMCVVIYYVCINMYYCM